MMLAAPAVAQSLDYDTMEQMFHEPVTASATGQPQRASDAPVNIEIITQDDIQRSGALSIPDVLQSVAGVDIRHYGVADAEVGIRGYNQAYNPRLLVMVNGRQVYADDYGHVAWAAIPVQLAEIRQIEVIKGPNSALYGFNAVSGVINIITYDPLRDKVNTATVSMGTQNYLGGSAVGTGQIGDNGGLRISLGGFHATDFPIGDRDKSPSSERQSPDVGAFNLDARGLVTPDIVAFAEVSLTDTRYAENSLVASYDTLFLRTNSFRIGVNADTAFGLININAYRNEQLVTLLNRISNDEEDQDVYVLQANDIVKLGAAHTVRIGVEYRNNSATSPYFVRGTIGYEVLAANAMWDWQITPHLALTNAVRVDDLRLRYSGSPAAGSGLSVSDYNHAGFAVPSFNSGLVYRVSDNDTLRLMVGQGVQLPSLIDFGLQFPAGVIGPVVVAGNPKVQPSIVDNVEVDYDRALPIIGSALRAAVFAQRNEDLISPPFGGSLSFGPAGLPVLQPDNIGNSNAIGTEISVKGHVASGFRWNASYAFVATTNNTTLNQGPVPTSAIDYAHSVPQHVVIVGIGYTKGKLQLDLGARWQSSYTDFRSTAIGLYLQQVEVSNYIALNARASYALTPYITLALTAQQFNAPLQETAGPIVERVVIGSVTAHF